MKEKSPDWLYDNFDSEFEALIRVSPQHEDAIQLLKNLRSLADEISKEAVRARQSHKMRRLEDLKIALQVTFNFTEEQFILWKMTE